MKPDAKRILIYSQHLGGTGHFIRTFEIASALAPHHEVYLTDSGRPVPRPTPAAPVHLVEIPRIGRTLGTAAGIAPLDPNRSLNDIMEARRQALHEAVQRISPDIFLVENFPFSKGMLAGEILSSIDLARTLNRNLKVVCSIRDMTPITRHDPQGPSHHQFIARTIALHFDLVLIHGDPQVFRMDEQLPWLADFTVPVHYTGYVSQRQQPHGALTAANAHTVLVSVGGTGSRPLLPMAIQAWKILQARKAVGPRRLVLFLPINPDPHVVSELQSHAHNGDIQVVPFTTDFLQCMQAADLSISHAGYNTCTNLLQTRVRAILVPNLDVTDQLPRTQRFSQRGLAQMIDPADLSPELLAATIEQQLLRPGPQHQVDLDGAQKTREILESQ